MLTKFWYLVEAVALHAVPGGASSEEDVSTSTDVTSGGANTSVGDGVAYIGKWHGFS